MLFITLVSFLIASSSVLAGPQLLFEGAKRGCGLVKADSLNLAIERDTWMTNEFYEKNHKGFGGYCPVDILTKETVAGCPLRVDAGLYAKGTFSGRFDELLSADAPNVGIIFHLGAHFVKGNEAWCLYRGANSSEALVCKSEYKAKFY